MTSVTRARPSPATGFLLRACATSASPSRPLAAFHLALIATLSFAANAKALTYGLAGGGSSWPPEAREVIGRSMTEAVDTFNQYGFFDKHVTANHNPGVATAQANYDGWIDFGPQRNTRTAMHEISHTLGTAYYWAKGSGPVDENTAAGRLIKVFDGRSARLNTGGTHFWPYNLNYDNEDGPAARERMCKLIAAFRFDSGIVKDSDGDRLPDDWETFHFGNLAQDGQGDPDGDGVVNQFEYATDCSPKAAVPVKDGRVYVLIGQITRRALSVTGASVAEAAATEQRAVDGLEWQQWSARYVGEGYFSFTNVKSGLVLEVPSTDIASGLPIRQAKWTGALKQQWRITGGPGGNAGYFQIANRETGRVVDGLDGGDGAPIQQYPFIGGIPQQFWQFQEIGGGEPSDAGADASPGNDSGSPGSGGQSGTGGGVNGGASSGGGGLPVASGGVAGAGGAGGSSSGGAVTASGGVAGALASGAAPGTSAGEGDSDGCGCRVATTPKTPLLHLLSILAVIWLRRRRG